MKTYRLIISALWSLFFSMLLPIQAQEINIPEPVPPPADVRETFDLDPFYQQWIGVEGMPVVASAQVSPYAVKEAVYLIRQMIGHRQDIFQSLVENQAVFIVMGHTEMITDIPAYRHLRPSYYWDPRVRGLGGTKASAGEENLLNYPGDGYVGFSVLIHEFAHAIDEPGLQMLDPDFNTRLVKAYETAVAKGLWQGTYAGTNKSEYWAEGSNAWFNPKTTSSFDRFGDTREELKQYDPGLAALLTEVYGDRDWRYTPVATRTHQPHLQGFNPQDAPTYQMPSDVSEVLHELANNPESTGDGRWVNLELLPLDQLERLAWQQTLHDQCVPTQILIGVVGSLRISVYRVEPDGSEVRIDEYGYDLRPFDTCVGDLWLVKDRSGENLALYRAEAETGRVLILPDAGPKIEGPWLWIIAPTQYELLGSDAAKSGVDYLSATSDGVVTEQGIATTGAIAGAPVGSKIWTVGELASTGGNNIGEMAKAIGLARQDYIEYHVAYGSIALKSPRQQETVMHVGSDDAIKVWLNGTLVHNNPIDRGADNYQESFPVMLKQGKNVLLVAVYQGWGGWSGFFGFEDAAAYSILPTPTVHIGPAHRPPMYWIAAEAGTLHRLVGDAAESFLPRVQNATGLVLDPTHRKMYWTEDTGGDTGAVKRANFDGSNVQLLATLRSVPTSIAVHAANDKLYWTNSRGRVQQANLNGQHIRNLIQDLKEPGNITVDATGSKIYWTEDQGRIRRANLNGKSIQNVADDLESIGGIAIAGNTIYWTEITDESSGKLSRANLNGSNLETLAELQHAPCCIAVDPVGSKLYWTDVDGNIRGSDLNGENVQDVASSLASAIALVLGSVEDNPAAPMNSSLMFSDAVAPATTHLLANYPNPFNPETWIPYQLSKAAEVALTIYDIQGRVVRHLDLGHQRAGVYQSRSRAAYWDGRNAVGEAVASGIYFYTLSAGDFTATRKMLIRK